jgi:predicted acylesterase/phospholipase RssA
MTKNALVISGGGSKGAFAVGAVEHLVEELNINFDIVSGTSIGALIAPLIITNEVEELVTIFRSLKTKDLLKKRCLLLALLKYDSIYDVSPGWRIIQKELNEERTQRVLNSEKQMFLTTVNLQTGQVVYFQSGPPAKTDDKTTVIPIETREQLQKAVLASANQPVLMSPVEVLPGSDPVRQYADGGVREIAPLKIVIDNGATDIYAVILSPEQHEPVNERFRKIPKILLRTISLIMEEILLNDSEVAKLYNRGILHIDALKKTCMEELGLSEERVEALFSTAERQNPFKDKRVVSLHIIRPKRELPTEGLEFEEKTLTEMIELGRSRASEILNSTLGLPNI